MQREIPPFRFEKKVQKKDKKQKDLKKRWQFLLEGKRERRKNKSREKKVGRVTDAEHLAKDNGWHRAKKRGTTP